MTPRDIFGLAVRILGLAIFYEALRALGVSVSSLITSLSNLTSWRNGFFAVVNLLLAAIPWVVAWWLVRGAPWLMRRAYPDTDPTSGKGLDADPTDKGSTHQ